VLCRSNHVVHVVQLNPLNDVTIVFAFYRTSHVASARSLEQDEGHSGIVRKRVYRGIID